MRGSFLLGLSLLGCAAAPVDYAALDSAASARQKWHDGAGVRAAHDARKLLQQPLTADTAARVALLQNRGAKAAAEELGIAQAELAAVRRLPNPELHGALRFRHGTEPDIDVMATLDVSALLFAISRSNAAEADVAAAKLQAVGVLVDLSFDARRAFVRYQATLELLELRQSVLDAFEASAAAAARLREAGNVTELNLASEQAEREQARLALVSARAEAAVMREAVNAVMGISAADAAWQAPSHLPELPLAELPLERLEAEALRTSLDMAAAKQRFAAAARHAGIANVRGWLPELKAGVSAERSGDWGVGPAVQLEVPLFYQGQGEVGVARARMRQAEHLYADAAVQTRSAARSVQSRLDAARRGVAHAHDVVLPLRERVVQQTQLEYNGMLVGIFQLLEAKRQELATAEQYLSLRRDYWLARLEAEQLLAGRRPTP